VAALRFALNYRRKYRNGHEFHSFSLRVRR
jgi:hypothetical protein